MIPGVDSDQVCVPGVVPVLGVVPVVRADPAAPGGCAALRELRGATLMRRAVDALVASGRVDRVVLSFGPVRFDAGSPSGAPPGASSSAPSAIVVVHDPLHALAPATLVGEVVDELLAHPEADGVVPVRPVTDTLKRTGPDGVVTATADREAFRVALSPQAFRVVVLARLVPPAPGTPEPGMLGPGTLEPGMLGPGRLPGLVRAAGGRLRTLTGPGDTFAVTTDDDLALAEAVLAAG